MNMRSKRRPLLPRWGEGIYSVLTSVTTTLTNFSDAPRLDAERIILHTLNQREPSYLITHATDVLSDEQRSEIQRMADERKTGKPLAYILGEADFYGRTFMITPDVLIPRPDTEALIEKALEYIQNNFADKKEIVIADICTGSGIIAITLALELPEAILIATDISPAALEIAKKNAEKYNLLDTIEFLAGDMLSPIKNRHVDLIVSNPPYVPSAELSALATHPLSLPLTQGGEITRGLLFEPRIALDGGQDGQKFVERIKKESNPPFRRAGIPAIVETTGGGIIYVDSGSSLPVR